MVLVDVDDMVIGGGREGMLSNCGVVIPAFVFVRDETIVASPLLGHHDSVCTTLFRVAEMCAVSMYTDAMLFSELSEAAWASQ